MIDYMQNAQSKPADVRPAGHWTPLMMPVTCTTCRKGDITDKTTHTCMHSLISVEVIISMRGNESALMTYRQETNMREV